MILGVGHLALSVTDTDYSTKELVSRGFVCQEVSKAVSNPPQKRGLLENYESFHDLAIFKPASGKGLRIEITNHGQKLSRSPKGPYEYRGESIGLVTPDIKREVAFWVEALGLKEAGSGALSLRSPIPNLSLTLHLKQVEGLSPSMLDAEGYPCLALVTSDIAKDASVALRAGALEATEPFKMVFSNREVDVIMFRTPGGAIVELVKIRTV